MNHDVLQKIIRIIKLLRTHDNDQEAEKFEMVSALEAELSKPEHPDLRKAAEMALDALLTCDVDYDYDENPYNTFDAEDVSEAIETLRQALARDKGEQA